MASATPPAHVCMRAPHSKTINFM